MKNKIICLFLLFGSFAFIVDTPNYKAIYRINYISNLDTKAIRTERAFLIIEKNQQSSYTTENTYKQDSIMNLVAEGKLNPQNVMNDKFPKTGFDHFVQKNYLSQNMRVSNKIAFNNYVYNQKNDIIWQLQPDTLKIKNYICYKATTTYAGRDYIAWYTTEIPISDGPYKFWGLPGLIIKIHDSENQYIFSLESFEKYSGKSYNIPFQSRKYFEITYEKFKILYKESIENPLKVIEDQGGPKVISVDGKDPSQIQPPRRNSIERY